MIVLLATMAHHFLRTVEDAGPYENIQGIATSGIRPPRNDNNSLYKKSVSQMRYALLITIDWIKPAR